MLTCILFYRYGLTKIGLHDDNRLLVPDLGAAPHISHGWSLWCSAMEEGMACDVYVLVIVVDWVYYFARFA